MDVATETTDLVRAAATLRRISAAKDIREEDLRMEQLKQDLIVEAEAKARAHKKAAAQFKRSKKLARIWPETGMPSRHTGE